MKCPSCRTDNPDVTNFSDNCGTKLILIHPRCKFEHLPGKNFCGECGQNPIQPSEPASKEISFDKKLDKIQRYLPKGLAENILSQRDKIEVEREQVAFMFSDTEF